MSTFQSSTTINKPAADIYRFLIDMNNHQQLMPADDITDWASTATEASFNVRNMLKLSLKLGETVLDKEISIIPAEKPPFDLELKWLLTESGNSTNVDFTITAGLNMMMKMLASGPLQQLADDEIKNLYNILNG